MEPNQFFSNLLITYDGKLVLIDTEDFEVLGVKEAGNELAFKLRN